MSFDTFLILMVVVLTGAGYLFFTSLPRILTAKGFLRAVTAFLIIALVTYGIQIFHSLHTVVRVYKALPS